MALAWDEIKQNAVSFYKNFMCTTRENADSQRFIVDFLKVFGVDFQELQAKGECDFEYKVNQMENHIGYIDFLWKGKLLIEMKSRGKDLDKAMLQARHYLEALPSSNIPNLIMVSDFKNIWLKVRETQKTYKIKTQHLHRYVKLFADIAGYETPDSFGDKPQIEANIKAAKIMAQLHDDLKRYGYDTHELEVYLVRILFCLFAENTDIFERGSFENYIRHSKEDGSDLRNRLDDLFDILDTPENDPLRDALSPNITQFRYINGKLFEEHLHKPVFDAEMRKKLIKCTDFDWSNISPAVFGAMFQGVMDEKLRREMGAHYTSEDNILKVIRPLFLDNLWNEFKQVRHNKIALEQFHTKIASLKFLDPACGCGNFLIVAYRELRKLEYAILNMLIDSKQSVLDISTLFKVNINQFYGIEIEEFPCRVAQVGMWLMEHQMNMLAADQLGKYYIDLPLKSSATIINSNALLLDWNDIIPKFECSYIMGNPPFVGKKEQTPSQKADMNNVFSEDKNISKLDYVTAWYKKSIEYIQDTDVEIAFVSTNSITQGEQIQPLWSMLFSKYQLAINFAYRTFKWDNDAPSKAAVHCVIIGIGCKSRSVKYIYDYSHTSKEYTAIKTENINPYLIDAPNFWILSRNKPISKDVPVACYGNMALDNGFLILSDDERERFIADEPITEHFIKRYGGGKEIINNTTRWCLWLKEVPPSLIRQSKLTLERIEKTKAFRESSNREATRKAALFPHLFGEIRQISSQYLVIPKVSSENRIYIPISFLPENTIINGSAILVENPTLYDFGILQSAAHMAWIKTIGGRLEMRYQYSVEIIYNNFPWPMSTEKQKTDIEIAAQAVLDARGNHPDCTLADLYDTLTMPRDLIIAHQKLDNAVMKAYKKKWKDENDIVSDLLKLWQLNELV